jgi:fermentation-respiration switch protein FrsA (DUF1100 family)
MPSYSLIWKVLIYPLSGYLALCALVFFFQRNILYLPFGIQISEQGALVQGLRHWPSLDRFQGLVSLNDPIEANGTVIVFHGNAGAAFQRSFYMQALSNQNMRVILAEYPGYGGRNGRPNEEALVSDALETIKLAHQEYGEPIFLWGESLGSGVISSAVHQTEIPIQGLVLFLTWDNLPNVAQSHYWYLPARWLVLDKYNNIENLQSYQGKIAVVLAGNDEVIPLKHGKALYNSITAEKKLWMFDGVQHNDIPVGPNLDWWQEVIAFISQ